MSAMRKKINRAKFTVYYPDGCMHSEETLAEADIATNAELFGRWLMNAGEAIVDACRPGQHGKQEKARR